MAKGIEIVCTACGAETFVRREPRYDGFRKTGERFTCAACGHEFPDERSVPYRASAPPAVFGAADRPDTVKVFKDDEKGRVCRYCRHYVVNPFAQRCGLHNRAVEATDFCADFEAKSAGDDDDADPLDRLLKKAPKN